MLSCLALSTPFSSTHFPFLSPLGFPIYFPLYHSIWNPIVSLICLRTLTTRPSLSFHISPLIFPATLRSPGTSSILPRSILGRITAPPQSDHGPPSVRSRYHLGVSSVQGVTWYYGFPISIAYASPLHLYSPPVATKHMYTWSVRHSLP